ncbi:LysR family transcriptional regulator [Paracidovorax cattleyae]|uniref:DNA-binding transcriptional regulator, LysR family n=1 Tax=Paracidovorax cattleyae TaxID=80868 RepID=A0A1H0WP41_9BURK|nr:LysR family transcriptional regulator [Paracidovorax cattleyae]SDP92371.1 DNA-binding transcriptional regulator, LysR family [Paracidovorax cattleyae]
MRIEDIEAFVAVVRSQSLSRAAQELGVPQPILTRRVQGFESDLGAALFDRQTKPLRPTVLGQRLYEPCRAVLQSVDTVRELAAADLPPSGGLRLGLTQGLGELSLLPLLADLRRQWPDLAPQVSTGWSAQLAERIGSDELDAAVVFQGSGKLLPRNVEGRMLQRTRLVVLGARGIWKKRSYRLAECGDAGWVLNPDGCGFRAGLQRALIEKGLPLRVRLDTYTRDLQLRSVEQGVGLGLLPLPLFERSGFTDRLDVVTVSDFKPEVELWLMHGKAPGRLQAPVDDFAASIVRQLGRGSAAASAA